MKTAWSMTVSHRDPHIVVKKILIFRFIARIKNSEQTCQLLKNNNNEKNFVYNSKLGLKEVL